MDPITMVRSAIGTVIVAAILLVPVHEVEQAETYYVSEPLSIATNPCGRYIWSKGRGGAGSAVRRVNPDRPDWSDAVEAHTWTISLGSCCGRGS